MYILFAFLYVLAGWKGSVLNGRVLQKAFSKNFHVPPKNIILGMQDTDSQSVFLHYIVKYNIIFKKIGMPDKCIPNLDCIVAHS